MRRFVEIMWLAVAAITAVEGYLSYTSSGWVQRTYMMIGVFALSIFMYYMRKRQRIAINKRKENGPH